MPAETRTETRAQNLIRRLHHYGRVTGSTLAHQAAEEVKRLDEALAAANERATAAESEGRRAALTAVAEELAVQAYDLREANNEAAQTIEKLALQFLKQAKALAARPVAEGAPSPLEARIRQACGEGHESAAHDALTVIRREPLRGDPLVSADPEEDILSLQWQGRGCGVALLFAGDGGVSISFMQTGRFGYAENSVDLAVTEPLPPAFWEALSRIEAEGAEAEETGG